MAERTRPLVHDGVAWLGRHWKTVAHWVVVLAALGYLIWEAPLLVRSLDEAKRSVDAMRPGWVAAAGLTATGALVLYGEMHRRLVVVGGTPIGVGTIQAITFAENAIANTVPVVGGAGAFAYGIGTLRRHGVDTALASWAIFLPGVLSTMVLFVLALLAAGPAGWLPVAAALGLAVLAAAAAVALWIVVTRASVLRGVLQAVVGIGHRLPWICHHCRAAWRADPEAISERVSSRIGLLRPGPREWVVLVVVASASWVLDFVTLNLVAAAVGVPWHHWPTLALGFLVVQASIALQVLPGGAGLAETGLLGVMVAGGIAPGPGAATAVVYRVITWLGLSLVGWAVYAAQIHHPRRLHRHSPEAVAQPR